ncbi:MAG: sensor signal transduction histidine kinase [Planctomycetota bacterium]|nr:sensor signal transduction histidine kinase [Planctomycetota bacterium]
MRRLLVLLVLLNIATVARAQTPSRAPSRIVKIGILADEDAGEVLRLWTPTARYLEAELPGNTFVIIPLTADSIEDAAERGEVDFVLSDPAQYIKLEIRQGARHLLTLNRLDRGVASNRMGAVIVCRADRTGIQKLSDLRGKRFVAVERTSFGGWIMAWHELYRRGINPARDFAELRFAGSQEAVIRSLLDGTADGGTIRSDLLGPVDATRLRVLEPRADIADYPLPSTTPLAPEWPLTALKATPEDLSRKVVIALLKLPPDDPAVIAAHSSGWTTPMIYSSVRQMLRDLRLPPYQHDEHVNLTDAVREYRVWLYGAAAIMLALIAATILAFSINSSHAKLRVTLESELAEREKAERALGDSEVLYHSLVETLPQNIFRKGTDERFSFVNRRFCATVGKTAEEILGKTDADFFPPELADKYRNDDQDVVRNRTPYETVEKHITPDGQIHYVQVIKSPLLDTDGAVTGIQGIFWDVTGKKRAEEELARSEERFALAVRGSNDGLWDWNIVTDEIYYSPRFKELLGFLDHELPNSVDMHIARVHPDDVDRVQERVLSHIKDRVPFDIEYRILTKSNEYHWFHARGQALWDRQDRATRMAGSLSDITSRKLSEAQLLEQNVKLQEMARSERKAHQDLKQAQSRMVSTAKLAGLGEMVAGVAHEINNPLSFVSNNVCVLQRDLAEVTELIALYRECDPAIEAAQPASLKAIRSLWEHVDLEYTLGNLPGLLNRTRDGLKRIQQIVKDLRVFARLDESDLNEVDLNAGIDSTVNIVLGHAKKKQVKIELDLNPLPAVACFPAKINQVIMNLVSNAIDASHENGVIAIRSSAEASGVRIEVEDYGSGIPPEVRERIFDPFFTTKPVGIGTGLGLSISYGIVQDHGGSIEVESTPCQGTKFTVHLPLKMGVRTKEPAARENGSALASGLEM